MVSESKLELAHQPIETVSTVKAITSSAIDTIYRPYSHYGKVDSSMHRETSPMRPFFRCTRGVEYLSQVDLEVAKVDVSYVDSFVQTNGFVAW